MGIIERQLQQDIETLLAPHFVRKARRYTFVEQAFRDVPRLVQYITFEGSAAEFTTHLVDKAIDIGKIGEGQLALVALLDYLRHDMVDERQIADLNALIVEVEAALPIHDLLFVIHSWDGDDRLFVQQLGEDLDKYDHHIWRNKFGLKIDSAEWHDALWIAIEQAVGVILVLSSSTVQAGHVHDELALAQAAGKPIYPLWIEGHDYTTLLPLDYELAHPPIDMRGKRYDEGLRDLNHALLNPLVESNVIDERVEPLPTDEEFRNPYKGLVAFGEADTEDFFGRDALIAEMVAALRQNNERFLTILGAFGSGKSSVVRAGLLPQLKAGALPNSAEWTYLEMMPSDEPLVNLALALEPLLEDYSLDAIKYRLAQPDKRGLVDLAEQALGESRLVLFIDQFEEVFTLVDREQNRQQFLDLVTTAIHELDSTVTIILTLRADFYDRLLLYPTFGKLVEHHHIPVWPMSIAELYDAIRLPARLPDVQLEFEPKLALDLLYKVRNEKNALPALQFTLDQLVENREGQVLTHEVYNSLGTLDGAVENGAERSYASLPPEHHESARTIFLRLVEISQSPLKATRRRLSLKDLIPSDPVQKRVYEQVIEVFEKPRLLVRRGDRVEIAHETLIREWLRLKDWLLEDQSVQLLIQTLPFHVTDWLELGKPEEMLYQGEALQKVLFWARSHPLTEGQKLFLNQSLKREIRR